MIPNLGDLAVLKTEDVDGGERRPSTRRFQRPPRATVRTRCSPTPNDIVVFRDEDVDIDAQVGER